MMHELRKDPLLNRWVVVLSDSKAPEEYIADQDKEQAEAESSCIYCSGREKETSPEITAIRKEGSQPNSSDWWVRVVPKSNPILQVEGDMGRKGIGMYDKMSSIGANEVIIEAPEHNIKPEDMGLAQMIRIASIYKARISDLQRDMRLRYIMIYKNSGHEAGAVNSHSHSQIISTPVLPKYVKEELIGAKNYFAYKERCIFCDIMREEINYGKRLIFETKNFTAFCPYAQRFPFEFWIMPKRHSCAFEDMNKDELDDFSLMLMTAIKKLRKVLKNPPYNYIIHTAPNRVPRQNHWHTLGEDYHWHLEVIPRLVHISGFEWGSDFHIITTSPEDAASYLRGG
ncbi:MAG: galactose-1-phosphate uridylyltransferase [Nitrospiraceae bacterium]|nr:galactose-1-phosphate uridylyltransferase [Nitrospiraceae bacterium]